MLDYNSDKVSASEIASHMEYAGVLMASLDIWLQNQAVYGVVHRVRVS